MDLKRVTVKYSTNFWSFFDQNHHTLEIVDTKTQKRDKNYQKKNICAAFNPKTRKWS